MSRKIRVGINGFGRMGRLVLRAGWGHPNLEFVHINEIKGGAVTAAHLLEFDSVHGRWGNGVACIDDHVVIDQTHKISFSENATPGETDWVGMGCDVVLECTGKFKTPETLQPYFDQGVKKVIVAAPVKEGALNIVYGVNDDLYDPAQHHLLTAASCTTNCLAPVVKVIHENLGIRHGSITTIHDLTNTQSILDTPHKDLRRARASGMSLIPTSTGSATAIAEIFPELRGKLNRYEAEVLERLRDRGGAQFKAATGKISGDLARARGHPTQAARWGRRGTLWAFGLGDGDPGTTRHHSGDLGGQLPWSGWGLGYGLC